MSFTAYNVKTKRKETMVNPQLKKYSKHGRTTYMLMAKGSDGTKICRIISHDQAGSLKKRKSASSPKRRTTAKRCTSTKRRTTKRRSSSKKRKSFSFF